MGKHMFRILDTKGEDYVIEGKDHRVNWRVLIAKKQVWHSILRIHVTKGCFWNRKVVSKLIAEKTTTRKDFKPGTKIDITRTLDKKAKVYSTTIKQIVRR